MENLSMYNRVTIKGEEIVLPFEKKILLNPLPIKHQYLLNHEGTSFKNEYKISNLVINDEKQSNVEQNELTKNENLSPKTISTSYISNFLENICRICVQANEMTNLDSNSSSSIYDDIFSCFGIMIEEFPGCPTQVCNKCINDLSLAITFRKTCLSSDGKIKELIQSNNEKYIKEEINEFEETQFDYDSGKGITDESDSKLKKKTKTNRKSINPNRKTKKNGENKEKLTSNVKKSKKRGHSCCDIEFKNKSEYFKHKRKFHDQGGVCEVCGKYYPVSHSIYQHLLSHRAGRLQCDHCSYTSTNKMDMAKHVQRHLGNKPYICDECPCRFLYLSHLNEHKKRHTNLKRFRCSVCGKAFFDNYRLRMHVDRHNSIKRFECEVCHSRFFRRYQWTKHLLKKHNIETPKVRSGPKPQESIII